MMSKFKKFIIRLVISTSFCLTTYAAQQQINLTSTPESKVNILTWWGYLDWAKPKLKEIGQRCHAEISFDDYYSYSDFLRRINSPENSYSIAIFSDTVSPKFMKKIALPKSRLYKVTKNYMPSSKKHYTEMHYPHNVVYFEHAVMAIVYNPKILTISQGESLQKIFKDSVNNIVVMVDDPIEANMLLTMAMTKHLGISSTLVPLKLENFKHLMQKAQLIITNSPWHIIQLPNFAVAFQWSGDAITMVEKNPKLKVFIDTKTSYITSDLLAELNTQAATHCVATALSSKNFLTQEEIHSFYISPYGSYINNKNMYFHKTYDKIMKIFSSLPWIRQLPENQLHSITTTWALIKLKTSQENSSAE